MNREQIEKAGRDYALDQLEIVGLPGRAEAMKAFSHWMPIPKFEAKEKKGKR